MSTLRKPTLGPIVGHTTHNSCRLWIAASDAGDPEHTREADTRTLGVIGVVSEERGAGPRVKPEHIYYFRLRREYDRTGSINLGAEAGMWQETEGNSRLKPFPMAADTDYVARMAVLNVDDAFVNDYNASNTKIGNRLPDPSVWAEVLNDPGSNSYEEARFRTFPAPPANGKPRTDLSFLLGSCRYPGLMWKRKHADRIFGPMLQDHKIKPELDKKLAKKSPPIQFALMAGDQIYADMLNRHIPFGLADTYAEFQERYHSAFGSRNMREFLRRVPTYMILDDHEIEDNWTQDRIDKDRGKRVLFNLAIGAYMSYQWSHGPRSWNNCFELTTTKGMSVIDKCLHTPQTALLYYDFLCAGYPFFVLDTRTQRFKDDREDCLDDNHLLGRPPQHVAEPGQLDRLIKWLIHQQDTRGNTPKFIVSSCVFVPNAVKTTRSDRDKDKSDSWPAYPTTRRALLDTIVTRGIDNVIFLSGDIHNSNVARLKFRNGPGDKLHSYSITSSAFYWPFPFADGDPSHYVHDSRNRATMDTFALSPGNGTMDYTAWGFTQADNFCRIDTDRKAGVMSILTLDHEGKALETVKERGAVNKRPHRLELTEW